MSQTAFVSGATGYIAQHIVKLLLEKGYLVVGSVRSKAKGDNLKSLFGSGFSYEVVADIVAPGAFDAALKRHPDISIFFHTASPVHAKQDDIEDNLLRPAIEGTKNALKAVKDHGKNVTRFVLTSSIATLTFPKNVTRDTLYNEDSWSEITWEEAVNQGGFSGYIGSKTLGEKAAWEFAKTEKPQFDLVTVHPAFVFGPQAFDSEVGDVLNTTAEFLNSYTKLKPTDPYPPIAGGFYDVRDVAKAHLVAAENKNATNQRLLLVNGSFTAQTIANILRERFPLLRENIAIGDPDAFIDWKIIARGTADDSRTRKLLGFEPISLEESIVDTINQIFKVKQQTN